MNERDPETPPATAGTTADTTVGKPTDERRTLETVLDAAVDAELETGARESDQAAARAHIVVRILRSLAGAVTVVVGVALTVLPGPGVLLILAGLGILAVDYPFAARLRDRLLQTGGRVAGRAGRILKRALIGLAALGVVIVVVLAFAVVALINLLR